MPEEFNNNKLEPKELAKQLRQPEGETGKQVGVQMNKGNKNICLNSYKVLHPKSGNHILEIGMGNGFFVQNLLEMAENINYTGADFSPTMVTEAELINNDQIAKGNVKFVQASIENLPFEDNTFDSITTTNTLYFWPEPANNARELLRVLKPGGKLLIAYRSKSFLDQVELSNYGFKKYEQSDVEDLLASVGFKNINTEKITEPSLEFDGKSIEMIGHYTTGLKS